MKVTQKDLENKVARLNRIAGFENPKYSTIGAYCLSHAHGGVAVHKYCNEHGAVHDVFNRGHMPKSELYERICAFEVGLEGI